MNVVVSLSQLISQGAAASGLSELIVAIRRSQDPYNLSEKIVSHLEVLLKVGIAGDRSADKGVCVTLTRVHSFYLLL